MIHSFNVESTTPLAARPQPTRRIPRLATLAVLACWTAGASAAEPSPQYTATLDPLVVLSMDPGGQSPNKLMAMQVSAALNSDPLFRGSHFPVTVAVSNGKVLLRGIVYNEVSRAHARNVVEAIPGVQSVVNELQTLEIDG